MNKKNIQKRKFENVPSHSYVSLGEAGEYPLLVIPKQVFFPENVIPLSSLKGLKDADAQKAKSGDLKFGVVTRLSAEKEKEVVLSGYGTEAQVTALIKLPNGELGAMIKGLRRFIIKKANKKKSIYYGQVIFAKDHNFRLAEENLAENKALKALVVKFLKLQPNLSQEALAQIFTCDDPVLLGFLVAPYLPLKMKDKLSLLANFDFLERTRALTQALGKEVELLQLSSKIQDQVKDGVHDSMRRNYLREQMQIIKKELGDLGGSDGDDITVLKKEFDNIPLNKVAREAAQRELDRLSMMHPGSPEYMVSWTYLSWLKSMPWETQGGELLKSIDEEKPTASEILDTHHYGLYKIKERILEFIAVLKHKGKISGQILLFSGPPGVGKTSLGQSIAKSLGRPFVRISLGGVKDEAEIRGHRRTYIGSMPGKIIHAIKEAGSSQPVILLDEIDKSGNDGGRDLSSALLEVLDPEQNKNFTDHYLGVPFDLSQVLFIATANSIREISEPLLDRMEVLELSGYTETEKTKIATQHLLPKIKKDLCLENSRWEVDENILSLIIRYYTREAGVRELMRLLSSIGRKLVRKIVDGAQDELGRIHPEDLVSYIGSPKYFVEPLDKKLPPGVAIGLAYTRVGGDILYIESRKSKNLSKSGNLLLTGSLGKVMQESAQTVFSYLLSFGNRSELNLDEIHESQVHIHLPDGATPKDGPSAGVALLCAMASLFSGISLSNELAMTGEITLRGQVLPVGGVKEKILAAHRYRKKEIIIPKANCLDLEDIPDEVLQELNIFPVESMYEVLLIAKLVKTHDFAKVPKSHRFNKKVLDGIFPFSERDGEHNLTRTLQ